MNAIITEERNKQKGRLVRFLSEVENHKYGICQYLGQYYSVEQSGFEGGLETVTTFYEIFRTGKLQDNNYLGLDSSVLNDIKYDFKQLPWNFICYIKTRILSENDYGDDEYDKDDLEVLPPDVRPTNNLFPVLPNRLELVEDEELRIDFRINDLPNSVWPIILSHLRISELPQIMTVCKKWKQHVDNDSHWKKRTETEYEICSKTNKDTTWKELYLQQDWEITINEVDRANQTHVYSSHKVKVYPNSSLYNLFKLIQKGVKFAGGYQHFGSLHQFTLPPNIENTWNPRATTVRETGLRNGSVLCFQIEN